MKIDRLFERVGNDIVLLAGVISNLSGDFKELLDEFYKFKDADTAGVRDRIEVEIKRGNGEIQKIFDTGWSRNGITNIGKTEVAKLIGGITGANPFSYIAIGIGTTPFDAGQTALVQEIKRKSATVSLATTNTSNDTIVFEATFSSGDGLSGSSAVSESGVFNASTGGVMLCRQTFSVVNLNWDNGDQLTVRWRIVIQQA